MIDAAAAYGPVRARPTGAPSRPADPRNHLHVVPAPTSEMPSSGNRESAPQGKETAAHSGAASEKQARTSDYKFRVRTLWAASRAYWTPPAVFTTQPASLADLADYARYAPWSHQQTGILRAAGLGYYRLVAYPATVAFRYSEWVVQRPGRLATHLGGLKLVASTGPGIWAVDHLIYPAAQLVGHILL